MTRSPSEPISGAPVLRLANKGYGESEHWYDFPDGRSYPSATTILKAVGKPALIPWAANQERQLVLQAAADLDADLPAGAPKMARPAYLATLEKRLGATRAHQRQLTKAGEIGSAVHALIEWQIRTDLGQAVGSCPEVTGPAAMAYAQFVAWRDQACLQPLRVEQKVWSHRDGYAGTLDLLARVRHPTAGEVTAVLDWKTGKAIYPEARLQSTAYAYALRDMGHAPKDERLWGLVVRLPKTTADPAFEVAWISSDEMADLHWPCFLAVKRLWAWMTSQAKEKTHEVKAVAQTEKQAPPASDQRTAAEELAADIHRPRERAGETQGSTERSGADDVLSHTVTNPPAAPKAPAPKSSAPPDATPKESGTERAPAGGLVQVDL